MGMDRLTEDDRPLAVTDHGQQSLCSSSDDLPSGAVDFKTYFGAVVTSKAQEAHSVIRRFCRFEGRVI